MHCILSSLALCTLPFSGPIDAGPTHSGPIHSGPTIVLPSTPHVGGVEWEHGSLDAAIAKAKDRGTMCLAYFWLDGSEQSGKLYQETLSNEAAHAPLSKMVCYSAKHSDTTASLFEKFKIKTVPTLLFLDGNGVAQDGIAGFIPLPKFLAECERIQAGKGTLRDLQYRLSQTDDESPEGIKARWLVAGKLLDLQDVAGHDLHMEKIRALDPKGSTKIGAQLLVGDLVNSIAKAAEGEKGEKAGGQDVEEGQEGEKPYVKFDLAPLYELAQSSKSRPVRYESWLRICRLEAYNKELPKASLALQETEKHLADEDARAWYLQSTGWLAKFEEHMTSKERKLAMRYASTGYKLADKARGKKAKDAAGSKDGYGVTDAEMARHCEALAIALHINRKQAKAVHFAKKAIELDPDNKYLAKTLKRVAEED